MSKKLLHYRVYRRYQFGVTLIEILISLLIGIIMLLAVTKMYGGFISASKIQEEQSAAQDQANFAFLTLNRSVRMAGAGLCVKPVVKAKTYLHQYTKFDNLPKLLTDKGLEKLSDQSYLRSFADPTKEQLGISLKPASDSDALLVIYSDSHTRRVDGIADDSGTKISAQKGSAYSPRHLASKRTAADDSVFYYDNAGKIQPTWVMISDCEHTSILKYTQNLFDGKDASVLPLPESGSFLYNYSGNGRESLIGRVYAKLFFVAEDSNGINQLYVKDLLSTNTDAQPLAAYVKRMQVEYQNPNNNKWLTTEERSKISPSNWGEEWPVRVTLTLNTGKTLGDQTYSRILDIRN